MSIAYFRNLTGISGHSAAKLAKILLINSEVEKAANFLDKYYLTTRDPDVLPGGAPFQIFSTEEGEGAIRSAQIALGRAKEELKELL